MSDDYEQWGMDDDAERELERRLDQEAQRGEEQIEKWERWAD